MPFCEADFWLPRSETCHTRTLQLFLAFPQAQSILPVFFSYDLPPVLKDLSARDGIPNCYKNSNKEQTNIKFYFFNVLITKINA